MGPCSVAIALFGATSLACSGTSAPDAPEVTAFPEARAHADQRSPAGAQESDGPRALVPGETVGCDVVWTNTATGEERHGVLAMSAVDGRTIGTLEIAGASAVFRADPAAPSEGPAGSYHATTSSFAARDGSSEPGWELLLWVEGASGAARVYGRTASIEQGVFVGALACEPTRA
ncbi:MAG: hypothetical protein U0234_02180 [Sandaracinus sp.]